MKIELDLPMDYSMGSNDKIIPLTLTLEGMLTLDWDKPGMAELGGLEDGVGILESPAAAADTAPVPVALELFLVLRGGIAPICTALRLNT